MAGKRGATSDLNHDNWNEDDDPEDSGTFTKASDNIMKNRVIKIAKRRNPIGTLAATEGDKKGAFVNFGAFTNSTSTNTASNAFGFLSNLSNKSEKPKTNGLSQPSTVIKTSPADTSSTMFKLPETKLPSLPFSVTQPNSKSEVYYAKIKGLNQSVSNWIKKHVDTNPLLNLTPIFRDYEKYLDEIESSHKDEEKELKLTEVTHKVTEEKTISGNSKTEMQKSISSFTFKPTVEANKTNSVTSVYTNTNTTTTKLLNTDGSSPVQTSPKFNFGSSPQTSSPSNASTFSFGKSDNPVVSSAGFTFGGDSAKPFMFSNVTKPTETENEDEEEQPPKVEFKAVVEKDHIYTVRCKVFVKKDDKFGDRGVGSLYLKPIPNNDKVQLIVRADTNLGNLLCNFILSKNIPTQRMGKKDVMLVCLPMPDSKPPPVPVLFRVKSPEEADELLRILDKHKK